MQPVAYQFIIITYKAIKAGQKPHQHTFHTMSALEITSVHLLIVIGQLSAS